MNIMAPTLSRPSPDPELFQKNVLADFPTSLFPCQPYHCSQAHHTHSQLCACAHTAWSLTSPLPHPLGHQILTIFPDPAQISSLLFQFYYFVILHNLNLCLQIRPTEHKTIHFLNQRLKKKKRFLRAT